MAIYGVDKYGLSKYGTRVSVEYNLDPFVAASDDYGDVLVSWTNPTGTWERIRLIRNRNGYPLRADDGAILFDNDVSPASFLDEEVSAGRFCYYAIFVQTSGEWSRAGVTSCLTIRDKNSTEWLWDKIPNYYKYLGKERNRLTEAPENELFHRMISVFGWAVDYQRTLLDTVAQCNDVRRLHINYVKQLAIQFGIDYYSDQIIEGARLRNYAGNAAHLARQKGTIDGLSNLIRTVTGWDTDIQIARNLLLDDDQSSFVHPSYSDWSPAINYAAGDRVRFLKWWYEAKAGGAKGQAQAPAGTGVDNTWWLTLRDSESSFGYNDATGGQYTWEGTNLATGASVSTTIRLGIGVTSPLDPSVEAKNMLFVKNTSGTTADFTLRSVSRLLGESTMDPMQPILDGIPVPYAYQPWDPDVEYRPNDIVLFGGRAYLALWASKSVQPPNTPTTFDKPTANWACIGHDGRIRLMLSGYSHQAYTISSNPAVPVWPFIEWYDDQGKLIAKIEGRAAGGIHYDSFTTEFASGSLQGRALEVGGASWIEPLGTAWIRDGFTGGAARPLDPTVGRAIVYVNSTEPDIQVAATLRTSPLSGKGQGLIVRATNTASFWRATRTALQKFSNPTYTTVATYSQPMLDGDRITVKAIGSAWTIYRNGVQVATATDSFNSTGTFHGMIVE